MTPSASIYNQIQKAACAVAHFIAPRRPRLGLVLGSGWGNFTDALDEAVALPYSELPGFAITRVKGHAGQLVFGLCGGTPILVLQGRVHLYEGHPLDHVVLPVRTLIAAGCTHLVLTNAAGAIRTDLSPGDLVLITDHLNLTGENPLLALSDERLGPQFLDLSEAYPLQLRALAHQAAASEGISLKEGIYAWLPGPCYETAAEIRALRTLGADLVGMSTVPEVIAAHHMGARVLGLSCITNMAAGLAGKISHDEVQQTVQKTERVFVRLLSQMVWLLHQLLNQSLSTEP